MTHVSPTVPSPGSEANASDISTPVNQIAAVINGDIDDTNISSISGSKIANGTVGTTQLADNAVTPAKLLAGTGASWGWSSWTPTFTSFTLGNGTLTAKYAQVGKTVVFRFYITLGTTSSVSGPITFSLPVTSSASYVGQSVLGNGLSGLSVGSGWNPMIITWGSSTTASIGPQGAGGTYLVLASTSSTVPFTWAANSFLTAQGAYEAA